jgi:hypothetical protein
VDALAPASEDLRLAPHAAHTIGRKGGLGNRGLVTGGNVRAL